MHYPELWLKGIFLLFHSHWQSTSMPWLWIISLSPHLLFIVSYHNEHTHFCCEMCNIVNTRFLRPYSVITEITTKSPPKLYKRSFVYSKVLFSPIEKFLTSSLKQDSIYGSTELLSCAYTEKVAQDAGGSLIWAHLGASNLRGLGLWPLGKPCQWQWHLWGVGPALKSFWLSLHCAGQLQLLILKIHWIIFSDSANVWSAE